MYGLYCIGYTLYSIVYTVYTTSVRKVYTILFRSIQSIPWGWASIAALCFSRFSFLACSSFTFRLNASELFCISSNCFCSRSSTAKICFWRSASFWACRMAGGTWLSLLKALANSLTLLLVDPCRSKTESVEKIFITVFLLKVDSSGRVSDLERCLSWSTCNPGS